MAAETFLKKMISMNILVDRYFFKTNCADLDTVIQEEVCCDCDTLPMFEGKVMARVKSIE